MKGWYINSNSKWTDFYDNEPFSAGNWTEKDKSLVVGGESCKWGCSGFCPFPVTSKDFDYYVWPIASVAAERLWSPSTVTDHTSALARLETHRTRLLARGVKAGPIN